VREGIVGADDDVGTGVLQRQAPHVGHQESGAQVGGVAFSPGPTDRPDADIRAGQTVPQPRKADELRSDTAGDIDDVDGPLVPAA
jgi:hypothetical protein